jgi:hypothetical protein
LAPRGADRSPDRPESGRVRDAHPAELTLTKNSETFQNAEPFEPDHNIPPALDAIDPGFAPHADVPGTHPRIVDACRARRSNDDWMT